MGAKFTLASNTNAITGRVGYAPGAVIHLSDGTCVFLEFDPSLSSAWNIYYTSDHSTAGFAVACSSSFLQTTSHVMQMAICRDNLDNLYVFGTDASGGIAAQAFTKGSGYSWTANAFVDSGSSLTKISNTVWCNTGGGTNSKGHILVVHLSVFNHTRMILDAGDLLKATPAFTITQQANNETFVGTGGASGGRCDLSPDGFGATSGVAVTSSGTALIVGAWAVSSTGTLTTNTLITTLAGQGNTQDRVRAIRIAANTWAVIYSNSTSGIISIGRWSASAQLTAPVNSGTPAGWTGNIYQGSLNYIYDAFYDSTSGKIWVLVPDSATATSVDRLGCAVGSGVTWDTAKVTDDTGIGTLLNQDSLRAVKEPVGSKIDWQVGDINGATSSLIGDYTIFASTPNAPTLVAPATSSYADFVSGGGTFTATYNSTDTANQNFYALRLKVGAGSYNYWRASDSTWQSTIQWNALVVAPGGTISVAITGLSNGNVYSWSIASEEVGANLQGPFATDFVVTASAAPTVVVNTPSGTASVSEPLVTWTPTTPAGAQINYRMVWYIAAEYGAGGFTPGQTPWSGVDSGVVSSAATSLQIQANMYNGGAYRVYVQIAQTGGQLSAWAYTGFTVAFNAPAQPLLTGSYDSATARSILNAQALDNLLTLNQASLETNTTGWAAGANTTLAQSATLALDGSFSLRLSSTAAGQIGANTPAGTGGIPILPSTQYTGLASFRAGASVRSCLLQVYWYQASGAASAVRNLDTLATINDAVGSWTSYSGTRTSPSDAAFAAIVLVVLATGAGSELHYVDDISLTPGASTTWTRGGLVGASTALFEYSDDVGASWHIVRGASAVTVSSPNETVAPTYDNEVLPLQTRKYRATIQGAGPTSGPPSALLSLTAWGAGWWLKDPLDPTNNVKLSLPSKAEPQLAVAEQIAPFRPLGRSTVVVLADAVSKIPRMGGFTCQTLTQANYLLLLKTINLQKTLLLQDAYGEQIYVRLIGRSITGPRGGRIREFQLTYYEVDKP